MRPLWGYMACCVNSSCVLRPASCVSKVRGPKSYVLAIACCAAVDRPSLFLGAMSESSDRPVLRAADFSRQGDAVVRDDHEINGD